MKQGLFSGFKISREDAQKTGRFLVFFLLAYIILTVAFSFVPGIAVEKAVAEIETGILGIFGISGNVSTGETAIITLNNGIQIQISGLCTGMQELMILVAAIIASIGIAWKKRIIGAVVGAIVVMVFNFLRITATILIIVSTSETGVIEFAHNVLFRVFLFFTIAIAYIAWFYWATKTSPGKK